MKTWIGLIISDERLKNTVQTLLKVTNDLQVVGIYSDAQGGGRRPEEEGRRSNHPRPRRRTITRSTSSRRYSFPGPYPVLGVGGLVEATPLLFDAFRLGMIDFIPFSPEDIKQPHGFAA